MKSVDLTDTIIAYTNTDKKRGSQRFESRLLPHLRDSNFNRVYLYDYWRKKIQ